MTADLAVHKALRARLCGTPAVTALVPAGAILDVNQRPTPATCIILGEGQTLPGNDIARQVQSVFLDLHCWKKETGTAGVKAIAGAVRAAIHSGRLDLGPGLHCGDCHVTNMRFLRDPDGESSHAVVTVETLVSEA